MKKFLLIVIATLACGSAFALPLGNPAEASIYTNGIYFGCKDPCGGICDAFSFRLGFYGDYVFNRNLRIKGAGVNSNGKVIQDTELTTNAGYLVVNYCDLVDVFATLGASNLSINTSEISWVANGNRLGRYNTDTGFSWSIGGRASLFQWACWTLGIEGQYFQFSPDVTQFYDGLGNFQFSDNNKWTYSEWQLGLGLSYTIYVCDPKFSFIPYAGVKWSGLCLDTDGFQFMADELFVVNSMENNKLWGWAVGATFTMCDVAGFTVEGRWADEKAFHLRGQVRF